MLTRAAAVAAATRDLAAFVFDAVVASVSEHTCNSLLGQHGRGAGSGFLTRWSLCLPSTWRACSSRRRPCVPWNGRVARSRPNRTASWIKNCCACSRRTRWRSDPPAALLRRSDFGEWSRLQRVRFAQRKIIKLGPVTAHLVLQMHADADPSGLWGCSPSLLQLNPIGPETIGQARGHGFPEVPALRVDRVPPPSSLNPQRHPHSPTSRYPSPPAAK